MVRVGEPLNLKDYVPRYKTDKRGALQEVTEVIESSVRQMLGELSSLSRPMKTRGQEA